jgi:hypothetical protein
MIEPAPPDGSERDASLLIRNCRFAFRCKQQWDSLTTTEHPRFRFCGDCQRRVVLCERDDELREGLRQNDCVAIPTALLGTGPDTQNGGRHVVGEIPVSYGSQNPAASS